MPTEPIELPPSLVDALIQLETATTTLTKLTDPAGEGLGDEPLLIMEFARRFEALRRRLGVVDQHVVASCDRSGAAAALCQRSTAALLAGGLQLSAGEAARRVRATHALSPRSTMTGVPLDPARPVLAAAVTSGAVSAESADVVIRCLDSLHSVTLTDPVHGPALVAVVERDLTRHAEVLRPEDLRTCAAKMIECYDPDGQPERDARAEALRTLRLVAHRDGGYSITGRLTGTLGAQLHALLTPLARPRPIPDQAGPATAVDTAGDETGAELITAAEANARARAANAPAARAARIGISSGGVRDDRDPGQRWHDAMADLIERISRITRLPGPHTSEDDHGLPVIGDPGDPDAGAVPATVIVIIGDHDLDSGAGYATTADGVRIPAADVRSLADQAEVRPTRLDPHGAVLTMGRSRRIATRTQTLALIARDGGCTFPGCDHYPSGANGTTSGPGLMVDRPTWTTSRSCVVTITGTSPAEAGSAP